jgi:acyl-CoA reductase-like NAD-dependent aldehyde dehydrogenase
MQKQLINGQWCDASNGNTWNLLNPATEETIAHVPYGNAEDANAAIEAAAIAFKTWSKTTPYFRAELLKKTADLIRANVNRFAEDTVRESGKPLVEAKGEWAVAANLIEWFAEEGKRSYGRVIPTNRSDKRTQIIYQPLGVVGCVTAWNFPAYNPARAWGAILAAGSTLVAKGSEYTPLSSMNLAWAFQEAGVPKGVINLVNGEAEPIGTAMLAHPKLKKLSFTGSTRVGKFLMDGASQTHTKLALELGGNAPVIIAGDVDVEKVARAAVATKFRNCGQVCISPQRFYIHKSIYKQFVKIAVETAQSLPVGDGLKESTRLGPLINARQKEAILAVIAQARKEKAKILTGGTSPEGKGYFINPTLIAATQQHSCVHQEIFGPVMLLIPFESREEVVEWANDTEYGLAAYIMTNSLQDAHYYSENVEFGMVGINEWAPHGTEAPFGGIKASGIGHESGSEGLLEYMEKKLISVGGL